MELATSPVTPESDSPPRLPSRRSEIPSTAWLATVRPKRANHAFARLASSSTITTVAEDSWSSTAFVGLESVTVKASSSSGTRSFSTATRTVASVSPGPKVTLPLEA